MRQANGGAVDWEAELKKWEPSVRQLAKVVRHPDRLGMSPEDVKQELRLAVVLHLRRDPDASDGKVYVGLRNLAIDFHRRTAAHKRSVCDQADGTRSSASQFIEGAAMDCDVTGLDPAAAALAAEELAAFRGLIYLLREKLSPAQFAILHLRYEQGYAADEVASATSRPPQRIWTRLYEARKQALAYLASIGLTDAEGVSVQTGLAEVPITEETRSRLLGLGIEVPLTEMAAQALLALHPDGDGAKPHCFGVGFRPTSARCLGCIYQPTCWSRDVAYLKRLEQGAVGRPPNVPFRVVEAATAAAAPRRLPPAPPAIPPRKGHPRSVPPPPPLPKK